MTYGIARWAARQAQRKNALKGFVNFLSRLRAKARQGGLVFIPDDYLLGIVMNKLQRQLLHTHMYYVNELKENKLLEIQFDMMSVKYDSKKYKNWGDRVSAFPGNVAVYYGLIRELRPSVIIETGTATGSMTSYILAALNKNKHGRLISLDLPPKSGKLTMDLTLVPEEIGYWIPDAYKDRWTYLLGDAKITLPRIMVEEKVDFFIHDSLHTRTHMVFEYAVARALMAPGTIIASDDVLWNNGFDDFLMMNRLIGWSPNSNPNISVTINEFDKFEFETGLGVLGAEQNIV